MTNQPGAAGARPERTGDEPIMFYAPADLKADAERMAKLDDPKGTLSGYLRSLIVADVRRRSADHQPAEAAQ